MPTMNQLPECEYCNSTENLQTINGQLVCNNCKDKGIKSESVAPPININEVLQKSRETDNRIEVKTDIFNSETVAIVDLKKAIDTDDSITNKPYALALELHNRYNKFKQVIFEKQQEIMEASNKQKAIQVYMNNLANQLRTEEREKLKLQDINYKPRAVKMPVNAKTIKSSKKKLDIKELRTRASELGVQDFTLRMICIQKGLSVDEAYKMMKANIEAAKAKS